MSRIFVRDRQLPWWPVYRSREETSSTPPLQLYKGDAERGGVDLKQVVYVTTGRTEEDNPASEIKAFHLFAWDYFYWRSN